MGVLVSAMSALSVFHPDANPALRAVLKMLNEIGSVDKIPEFIEGVKNSFLTIKNINHQFCVGNRGDIVTFEVAVALEKGALADEYFVKRKLYPNVDFYSGLIYRAMGFPTEFFPVLFAIPRMAGYLAHWRESLDDPDTKIMRPQQVYTGVWMRHYMPLKERMITSEADRLGQLKTRDRQQVLLNSFSLEHAHHLRHCWSQSQGCTGAERGLGDAMAHSGATFSTTMASSV
ncbi:hypothetical protein CRG98_016699 [Punica granatum]|uniref:Citrate synthase n=1 Tax=Punica granatum TaxID=22663 RepID=A0A2I0K2T4_PUNGR|nr:hypothetical protein CRG98_016699 [Punica granatum]